MNSSFEMPSKVCAIKFVAHAKSIKVSYKVHDDEMRCEEEGQEFHLKT